MHPERDSLHQTDRPAARSAATQIWRRDTRPTDPPCTGLCRPSRLGSPDRPREIALHRGQGSSSLSKLGTRGMAGDCGSVRRASTTPSGASASMKGPDDGDGEEAECGGGWHRWRARGRREEAARTARRRADKADEGAAAGQGKIEGAGGGRRTRLRRPRAELSVHEDSPEESVPGRLARGDHISSRVAASGAPSHGRPSMTLAGQPRGAAPRGIFCAMHACMGRDDCAD